MVGITRGFGWYHWVIELNVADGKRGKSNTALARQANRVSFSCFGYFHGCDHTTATLQAICKEYYERLCKLESEKYDTEYLVRQKDYEVSDMTSPVPPHRHPRSKEKKRVLMSLYEHGFPFTQSHWFSFSFSFFFSAKLDCKLTNWHKYTASNAYGRLLFKAAEAVGSFTESSYIIRVEIRVLLQQFVPTHIRRWSMTCLQSSFASSWKLCHFYIYIL